MADFLARASACSLPIILAWDFTLKKWISRCAESYTLQ